MTSNKGHTKPTKSLDKKDIPIYFFDSVIPVSLQKQTHVFQNRMLQVRFCSVHKQLISVPFAPWGSVLCLSSYNYQDFLQLMDQIRAFANHNQIKELIVKHPPTIYEHSISSSWYKKYGFRSIATEYNQHIDLMGDQSYHPMEIRKLNKLTNRYQVCKKTELQKYFNFLVEWRLAHDIPVNISYDHLNQLFSGCPGKYEIWVVENEQKAIAICICIMVTSEIVYYFLPATHPGFRSESPMVLLIHRMSEHYSSKGYKLFDLGQSSIDGNKQEGLYKFKERMGAQTTTKKQFKLLL